MSRALARICATHEGRLKFYAARATPELLSYLLVHGSYLTPMGKSQLSLVTASTFVSATKRSLGLLYSFLAFLAGGALVEDLSFLMYRISPAFKFFVLTIIGT